MLQDNKVSSLKEGNVTRQRKGSDEWGKRHDAGLKATNHSVCNEQEFS